METVTIKTIKKVETEKEMKIPSYWRSSIFLYKLISKENCLQIRVFDADSTGEGFTGSLSISYAAAILTFDHTIEITEDEFNHELNILTNKFQSL